MPRKGTSRGSYSWIVHITADIVSKSDVEGVKCRCVAFLGARHCQGEEVQVLSWDPLSHDSLLS